MNIEVSAHCRKRTIERVKKIKSNTQAVDYIVDKFSRITNSDIFNWFKVYEWERKNGNLYKWTAIHRFIYEIREDWTIFIITYHNKNKESDKAYKQKELKRIEKLFIS